jgi:hypothetical protein
LLIILFLLRKPVVNAFSGIFIRILTDADEDEDTNHKDIQADKN